MIHVMIERYRVSIYEIRSSSVENFSATDTDVDIARITPEILLIFISQIVCNRRLAAGVTTKKTGSIAIMLAPVSITLWIVSHGAAMASDDVSASIIDGQDTGDSKSTNFAHIITMLCAVVKVLVVLEIIGSTHVTSRIASVFGWMTRCFLQRITFWAGDVEVLA